MVDVNAPSWTSRDAGDKASAASERVKVYVHPGGYVATGEPTSATTILGSCVAVCLWDPSRRIGGMNHFLLPLWANEVANASWRYGNVAIEGLIRELTAQGARRNALRAKMFGGASVLSAPAVGESSLGQRNVEMARQILISQSIPIDAEATGGDRGRKLVFQTDDGTAWVKTL